MGGELVEHSDLFEHFENFEPARFAIAEAQTPPSEDVPPTEPCGHLARLDRFEHREKPCAKNSRKKQIRIFFSYQSVRVRLVQEMNEGWKSNEENRIWKRGME